MTYKVHKYPLTKDIDEAALERFLNDLQGEVIAIVPNMVPKMHMMGATAGFNYLIIVEKRTTLG